MRYTCRIRHHNGHRTEPRESHVLLGVEVRRSQPQLNQVIHTFGNFVPWICEGRRTNISWQMWIPKRLDIEEMGCYNNQPRTWGFTTSYLGRSAVVEVMCRIRRWQGFEPGTRYASFVTFNDNDKEMSFEFHKWILPWETVRQRFVKARWILLAIGGILSGLSCLWRGECEIFSEYI